MSNQFKFHCFLTHNWGPDTRNRSNHQRVVEVAHRLSSFGLKVWIDEVQMTGNIVDQMSQGIDDSEVVVIFVTTKYMEKLQTPDDNCRWEFDYAIRRKGEKNLISVVMEEEMSDPKIWKGRLGMILGGHLYISMWEDDLSIGVEKLIKELARKISWINTIPMSISQSTNIRSDSQTEINERKEIEKGSKENQDIPKQEDHFLNDSLEHLGEVFEKSLKEARKGDTDAMFNIGVLFKDGQGVKQDFTRSMKWFLKAAEKGHTKSMFNIGSLYKNGQGVKQDFTQSMNWFLKAADKGHTKSMFNIGLLFKDGEGVKQDFTQSMNWFLRAADKGHTNAMFNIGLLYENGQGVKQDLTQAMNWFSKAADKGHTNAKSQTELLKPKQK